eukprot:1161480-Pelagomonas_calceolata.AAC.17
MVTPHKLWQQRVLCVASLQCWKRPRPLCAYVQVVHASHLRGQHSDAGEGAGPAEGDPQHHGIQGHQASWRPGAASARHFFCAENDMSRVGTTTSSSLMCKAGLKADAKMRHSGGHEHEGRGST